jgi:hypothetical protein
MNDTTDKFTRISALAEHLDTFGDDGRQAAIVVRDVLSILRGGQDAYHGPLIQFAADLLHSVTVGDSLVGPLVGESVITHAALRDVSEMDEASLQANIGIVRQLDSQRRRARVQWPTHTRWVYYDSIAAFRTWRTAEVSR